MASTLLLFFVLSIYPSLIFSLNSNLTESLIAWYKFDGDILDSSGNGYDGSLNDDGTEYYSEGNSINSQSFYFDGNTRIEIDSLSNYTWDSSGYLSISIWLKRTKDNYEHMSLLNNGFYYCSSFELRLDRDNGVQAAVFSDNHEDENQGNIHKICLFTSS